MRILLFVTTHLSPTHKQFLSTCWRQMPVQPFFQNADVIFYLAKATWPVRLTLSRFPSFQKRVSRLASRGCFLGLEGRDRPPLPCTTRTHAWRMEEVRLIGRQMWTLYSVAVAHPQRTRWIGTSSATFFRSRLENEFSFRNTWVFGNVICSKYVRYDYSLT
jgi:hypothetical protein